MQPEKKTTGPPWGRRGGCSEGEERGLGSCRPAGEGEGGVGKLPACREERVGGDEGFVVGLVARQGSQLAAAAGRGSSWKSEEGRGGEGEGWQGVQSKIKTITNETNIEWFKSQCREPPVKMDYVYNGIREKPKIDPRIKWYT